MLNANLLLRGLQQAQQQQQGQDALRSPIAFANPLLAPIAMAGRIVSRPEQMFRTVANARENENIAAQREFLSRPQRPIINQGTGNTILGAAALAALLGASPEAINQGFGNFLQGTMARRQEEDERERALLQLQMAERQLQGQRAENTANRLQQAQDRMRQVVEQGRGQIGNILMGLTNASDPMQVQLGIDQANDIARRAGLPTVSPTVAGQLTRSAEERAQEAADVRRLNTLARQATTENINRDNVARDLDDLINVANRQATPPVPGTPLYNSMRRSYDALERQAAAVGMTLPVPFEAIVSQTAGQARLDLSQQQFAWRRTVDQDRMANMDERQRQTVLRDQRNYELAMQRIQNQRARVRGGEDLTQPERAGVIRDAADILANNARAIADVRNYALRASPDKAAMWEERIKQLEEDQVRVLLELRAALPAGHSSIDKLARQYRVQLPSQEQINKMAQDMQRAFERATGAGGSNSGNRPAP